MPTLDAHPASSIVKLLNIGENGTGKTGALASLAAAGYNLYILDFDNGLDILSNVLRGNPDALSRIQYKTLRDKIVMVNGLPRYRPPMTAYKDAGKQVAEWQESTGGFTPNDVLVLDTLTSLSEAAFNEGLALAGRLNQLPQQQDYGWMATSVMLFMEMLTDPSLNCHVVVNTHVRYLAEGEQAVLLAHDKKAEVTNVAGRPNAKGQEVSRTVARFFNTVVLTRSMGSGAGTKRIISTKPQGVVEVKTSAPLSVKDSYSVEAGLAPLFQDILGHGSMSTTKPPAQSAPKENT